MYYIENNSTNPYFNLACEEYCLKNLSFQEGLLMLWQNDNTIVVGRYQNTAEEINAECVSKNNIKVVRRMSGGGAVYHDLGNLNYTFIHKLTPEVNTNMHALMQPIVDVLAETGINAKISGRNDITVDGKKISGTAQYIYKDRIVFHGTLIFNANLSLLSECLNVKSSKINSKGIKSIRHRVENIQNFLVEKIDILELKQKLFDGINKIHDLKEYTLSDEDLNRILTLAQEKYSSQEWIYGNSPECDIVNEKRFPGGEVSIHLKLKNNKIEACKIYGDFLGVREIEAVERCFLGADYTYVALKEKVNSLDISQHLGGITAKELLSFFV